MSLTLHIYINIYINQPESVDQRDGKVSVTSHKFSLVARCPLCNHVKLYTHIDLRFI